MSEKEPQNEQENTVIDTDGKEIKPKKLPFYKKVWYSIVKFDKYIPMSLEGTGRAIKYLLQIVSIFVLIISCIGLYSSNKALNELIKNVEEGVPDFRYAEGKIQLNSEEEQNKVYTIEDKNFNLGKIIIDLNTEDENVIAEYENTIKNNGETNNIGIIVLKDKVMQITKLAEGIEGESRISMTYDDVMQKLFGDTGVEVTKSTLIEFLNGNGRTSILIVNFFSYFIAYFIIYLSSNLIYALVLTLIAAKITKIATTFKQLFAMSVYAFTLSTVLNIIYFIVNYFAGITIKYFDVAYIVIAYIYLVTVIFLMKNNTLRKQENPVQKDQEEEKGKADGPEQI